MGRLEILRFTTYRLTLRTVMNKTIFPPLLLCMLLVFSHLLPSCKNDNDKTADTSDSLVAPYLKDPAIKALTDQIKNDPKNPELRYQRSMSFMQMGKTLPAFADIKRAIELDSTNAKYYFHEADVMLSDGYAEGAVQAFIKVIQMQPENKDARLRLAKTYLYAGDNNSSLAEVKRLIEMDKTAFEPYFIAGMNYKELKDTATAIQHFQNALQFKPDFYEAYMQLGLLTSKRNSNEAPQYFDNALRLDSNSVEAWYAKAKYYQDHKQYDKAKAIYKQLISKSPQNHDAFFNLGFIYILQDSLEKAQRHFDLVLRVQPNHSDAYYYRALCESELGNKTAAREDLTRCLALDPENELAQNLLNTLNKQAQP